MPTPDQELKARYKVNGGKVRVSVIIGDAQLGRSRVYLDGTRIHDSTNLWKALVGSGVEGSLLVVRTVISDVNRHTNRVTATYVLEGGTTDEQWELSSEVDQDGEDAYFRAQFELR